VAPPKEESSFTALVDEAIEAVGEAHVAAHVKETKRRVEAGDEPDLRQLGKAAPPVEVAQPDRDVDGRSGVARPAGVSGGMSRPR